MSGNFKIRYTMPLGSGPAIASKLESYFQSGADTRLDLSQSGVQPLPNINFQRALHKGGVYAFNPAQSFDASGGTVIFDVSGKAVRVRLVDNSGNVTGLKYLDLSAGPTGSATF